MMKMMMVLVMSESRDLMFFDDAWMDSWFVIRIYVDGVRWGLFVLDD